MARGDIHYSEKILGETGNYHRQASFDVCDGFLGINDYDANGEVCEDRVLLSPKQVRALIAFYGQHAPKPRQRARVTR